jgi:hypothetical protein
MMRQAEKANKSSERWGRVSLFTLLTLAAFIVAFAFGALSWVRFFQDPEAGGGVPTRYFTDTDFPAVVIGSRLVSAGRGAELYNLDAQLEEQRRLIAEGYIHQPPQAPLLYPYPYTPFIALMWAPLSELNPLAAMALWDLINILGAVAGLWFLLLSLPLSGSARLLLLAGAVTSFPFIVNLEQGQSSGLVIFSLSVGIALLRQGKDLPAGLVLGLLLLKIQWLPLLGLVLLWKVRWRSLTGMGLTATVLLAVTFAALGTAWLPDFLGVIARAQNFAADLALKPSSSHSLSGGIAALLGPDADWGLIGNLHRVVTLPVVVLLLFLGRGPWRPGTPRWDAYLALVVMATLLTNVMLNTHDLSLIAIPAALGTSCLVALNVEKRVAGAWYALLWLSYLIPVFFLALAFSLALRPITLVMVLIMALLAVVLVRYGRYRTLTDELSTEGLKATGRAGLVGPLSQ